MRPFLVALVLLTLAQASVGSDEDCTGDDGSSPEPGAYLLVIDRSGSMRLSTSSNESPTPGEPSRWRAMQERASRFVDIVPSGAYVWIAVFDEDAEKAKQSAYGITIKSDADRQLAKQHIQGFGEPNEVAWTALFDTEDRALDAAESLLSEDPSRYVTLLIYTDGSNTVLANKSGVPEKLDPRIMSEEQIGQANRSHKQALDERFTEFKQERGYRNLHRTTIHLEPERNRGQRGVPLPIRMSPKSGTTLGNPKLEPEQTLDLLFCYWKSMASRLDGKELDFTFKSTSEEEIKVDIVGGPYKLRRGTMGVRLRVRNPESLKNIRYTGCLSVKYPDKVGGFDVVAEGRDSVDLVFVKGNKIEITDLRPPSGSTFALGQDIRFRVDTVAGANVTWRRGDVQISNQREFVYRFDNSTGQETIAVDVRRKGYLPLDAPVELEFVIVDLGVRVMAPDQTPVVGTTVELRGETFGAAKERAKAFEWVVNGVREPGAGAGAQMVHVFRRPGEHEVRLRAVIPGVLTVQSAPVFVSVFEKPSIRWDSPQPNSQLWLGTGQEFRADVRGPVEGVMWTVKTAAGDVLESVTGRRVEGPRGRTASVFSFPLAEDSPWLKRGDLSLDLQVTASAQLSDGVKTDSPVVAEAKFHVSPPKRRIKMFTEPVGTYRYGKPVNLRAELKGPGVEAVEWNIWRGPREDGQVLLSKRSSVAGGTNVSKLVHEFRESQTGDQALTVSAVGVLPSGYKTPHPRMELRLDPPTFRPAVLVTNMPEDGDFSVDQTVMLKIDNPSGHKIENVVWDLGDGQIREGPETEIAYQYSEPSTAAGPFRVTAQVTTPAEREPVGIQSPPISVRPAPLVVCTVSMAAIGLVAGVWIYRMYTGNGPRGWTISVSRDAENYPPLPQAKLRDYWSLRKKQAVIPMSKLMRRMAGQGERYWTTGAGKKSHLTVTAVGSGSRQRGSLRFSDEGDGAVSMERAGEETRNTRVWELFDDRAPVDEELRNIYLQLREEEASPLGDFIVLAITFLTILVAVGLTAHFTYFSRL